MSVLLLNLPTVSKSHSFQAQPQDIAAQSLIGLVVYYSITVNSINTGTITPGERLMLG